MTQEKLKPKLTERECARKAYDLWSEAGRPKGDYPKYRNAVEKWVQAGAISGELDRFLRRRGKKELSKMQSFWFLIFIISSCFLLGLLPAILLNPGNLPAQYGFILVALIFLLGFAFLYIRPIWPSSLKQQTLWNWITSVIVPIGAASAAVWMVLHEVRINRKSLETTIIVQREQNRQQVLKDYIGQMTTLITDKDLVNKYPENENGQYDPEGKQHPDATAAISLTKTVLKLLDKESKHNLTNSYNLERGSLVVFLYESSLMQKEKPVINLSGADLSAADLSRANLSGADLSGANLTGVDLSGADLSGAALSGADLSGANLSGTFLIEAELNWADLQGADMRAAVFLAADLKGANLHKVDLSEVVISGELKIKDSYDKEIKADFRGAKGLTYEQKADLKSRGAIVD